MPSNDSTNMKVWENMITRKVLYPEYNLGKQKSILKFNVVGKYLHVPKCIKVWL